MLAFIMRFHDHVTIYWKPGFSQSLGSLVIAGKKKLLIVTIANGLPAIPAMGNDRQRSYGNRLAFCNAEYICQIIFLLSSVTCDCETKAFEIFCFLTYFLETVKTEPHQ